ncbi:arylsulfatase [uncultured Eudoraea sp.]|uniref:arylsulfatase n=1 Tax=uncultured Eudoraea sp. TaxID=1035614 RepID=UPI00262E9192|nr:arylsulfatase [uncultured Eudoraea sp.]
MRPYLKFLLCFLLLGCANNTDPIKEDFKPNIILIVTDDQGWGDLSFNGNSNLQTPNLDNLAKNGVSFENFYVQPVCSPTRAEILCGRQFRRLGVYATSAGGERLNLGETTLAEVFKKAGYKTAAYGKWHSGMQAPYHPNSRGFDDFYGFASGHWGNYFDPLLEHNGKLVKGNGFIVDELTDKGLDFISKNRERPFLLYLPYNTPHSPMQVPDKYWNKFQNRQLSKKHTDTTLEDISFTKAALAMIENIDNNVGRITNKLKELNLEENTILVYLSDNGPNGWRWNAGMRGKKGSTDEGGVRSPLFISWKNTIPGSKSITQIASAIDILPTLAGLADIEIKTINPLDGTNLEPLIFEENPIWKPRYIYNNWNQKTSVRSQDFRLDDKNRLYHIPTDIGQTRDVSKEYPDDYNSLLRAKELWLKELPIPTTEIRPFTIGHPSMNTTQLPARDGISHGGIERSNKYPNCSFFTNWKSPEDYISWDVDVLTEGSYEVILYYSCAKKNVGATILVELDSNSLSKKITEFHDPPITGMENDRIPRIESYIKDFKPLSMGIIKLQKGRGKLKLRASQIPGEGAIDFRLLLFEKRS